MFLYEVLERASLWHVRALTFVLPTGVLPEDISSVLCRPLTHSLTHSPGWLARPCDCYRIDITQVLKVMLPNLAAIRELTNYSKQFLGGVLTVDIQAGTYP